MRHAGWLGLALTFGATTTSPGCSDDAVHAGIDAGVFDCCAHPTPSVICLCRDGGPAAWDSGRDAGRGARPDGDVGFCPQGQPCTPASGCSTGECIAERAGTLGDPGDPIAGLPGGATAIPTTSWIGGYCTTDLARAVGTAGACDFDAPAEVDDGCGPCGQCVNAGANGAGAVVTLCLAACTPAAATNPCRSGYTCSLEWHACMPACGSDAQCRVYREDTNRNGVLDRGVDQLVYDPESMATCNVTTGRCDHPGAPGAVAGIACERDAQCEENGECRTELASGWPGGYCTKRGCDVTGRECAGTNSMCAPLQNDGGWAAPGSEGLCFQACMVGQEPLADRLGPAGHGLGCRPGYRCRWNTTRVAGGLLDGVCAPGVYDDVTTNNVGAACAPTSATDDPNLQCYSPFGAGRCVSLWGGAPTLPTGICTILDCDVAAIAAADPCGAGARCVFVGGTLSLCLKSCTSASDCATGYACVAVSGEPTDPRACIPNCASDADCTSDRHCLIAAGATAGECVLR